MSQEVIIGIAVAVVVAVVLGTKSIVHRVLTFKMDESAIVNFMAESSGEDEFHSSEAISNATGMRPGRVRLVCTKSRLIQRNPKERQSWRVR
jgi:hypothetical protein